MKKAKWVIIVDEGPGLSGSSFAAVARKVVSFGYHSAQVAFLTAHSNPPGDHSSQEDLKYWTSIRRYSSDLEEIQWKRERIRDFVERKSSQSLRFEARIYEIDWRALAYRSRKTWPAVSWPFSKLKFICGAPELGVRSPEAKAGEAKTVQRLIWKFTGLIDFQKNVGKGVPPVFKWNGFTATAWVEGARMTGSDSSNTNFIAEVISHICEVSGPPLSEDVYHCSIRRLSEVLYWNTKEALGEAEAKKTAKFLKKLRFQLAPSYGDGRLMLEDWLKVDERRLRKVGGFGPFSNHFLIGEQPFVWDVAGLLVEWDLEEREVLPLIQLEKFPIDLTGLKFFKSAYAAFRMGECFFSAQRTFDEFEKGLLLKAYRRYRRHLRLNLR